MLNATTILEKVARLVPHLFWIIAPREAEHLVLLRSSFIHSDPKFRILFRKVLVIWAGFLCNRIFFTFTDWAFKSKIRSLD